MSFTFDGINKIISFQAGITSFEVVDLYSRWKEWVMTSDNSKFPPAFRVIGGDPLGGSLTAGSFFFLQNQDGWRIKPLEQNYELTVIGNLYPENISLPIFVPTNGMYTVPILMERSSLTQKSIAEVPATGMTVQQFLALR